MGWRNRNSPIIELYWLTPYANTPRFRNRFLSLLPPRLVVSPQGTRVPEQGGAGSRFVAASAARAQGVRLGPHPDPGHAGPAGGAGSGRLLLHRSGPSINVIRCPVSFY